jgi:hypothetical protein
MTKMIWLLVVFLVSGCVSIRNAENQETDTFAFGVVADVQYADMDTKGKRYYRESLDNLKEAVAALERQKLAFTIQLGDFINGNKTVEQTAADLDQVLAVYNDLSMPTYHVVGNHCLAVGKERLQEKLGLSELYYDFTVPEAPGWRFVVLDGNDTGYGYVGAEQLEWLQKTLTEASRQKEKVIIFCHYALLKAAARNHRMKLPEPVLEVLDAFDCVVAYFAGHNHAGGYAFRNGVHPVTIKGMLAASADQNAYAVIEVSPTVLREIGFGMEPSREMPIGSQSCADGSAPE